MLSGGQVVERNFALDEYPVYVKGGAILPFYTDKVKNLNGNDEEIVVTVFPGGEGFSCFDLYEDNGNDKNYDSQYAVTHLESCRKGNKQTIVVGGRKGMYKDMPVSRPFKVKVLLSHMPESVSVNGQPAKYTYQAEEFALLVELPVVSCEQEKRVEIVYGRGNSELNGLPGITRRMSKSMEALKYRNSYICFKEELGKMGSLNETVLYYPDEMENRVAEFWKSWSELPAVLERQGLKKEDVSWFLRNVGWERAF